MPVNASKTVQQRFIRQEAAAERWDVSVDTIRRLIASGKITGYRLNGRIIRVDQAEVDGCFRPIPTTKTA
ncbi:MAG: excisionase family DNA-binding protein [Acidobacteriota bacterium]|nr:excisionase family DNA-binding protein [Acidobacteriota bacterium]